MKRVFAVLLALMLLVSLLCVGVQAEANAAAAVGETNYEELAAALKAAQETSGTVVLQKDLDLTGHVTVPSGVTLDLNGKALITTGYVTVYGEVIDGAAGGKGVVSAKKIHLMGDDSFLPIYDTAVNGYRFYAYKLLNLGGKDAGKNAVKFGIRLELTNTDGYAVLGNTADSDLTLMANISWDGGSIVLPYTFKASTIAAFGTGAAEKVAQNQAVTTAIVLTITGLDAIKEGGSVYLQPVLTSDTKLSVTGEKAGFEKTAAIAEPSIVIETVTAEAGAASVAVKVSIVNNPGIYSIGFNTRYDDSVLTLKSVTYSTEFGGSGMAPPLYNNFLVSWFNNAALADVTKDGSFVTFVFDVAENAASGSTASISVVPNSQEFYNAADNEVALDIVNGGIVVR